MTPLRSVIWAGAIVLSGALSWWSWRGPPPRPDVPVPDALGRPATDAELAELKQRVADMQAAIDRASVVLGRPPRLDELEGNLPDGRPVLPGGLPDNPLQPGVGGVSAACPTAAASGQDWVYCESTGRVAAAWPSMNR